MEDIKNNWHTHWQSLSRPEKIEVRIGNHRADIVGLNNVIIELQNSPIKPLEIIKRESFYQNMIWLFNGSSWRIEICDRIYHNNNFYFKFKNPKLYLKYIKKPLFIDIAKYNLIVEIFNIIYVDKKLWLMEGDLIEHSEFIKRYIDRINKLEELKKMLLEIEEIGYETWKKQRVK